MKTAELNQYRRNYYVNIYDELMAKYDISVLQSWLLMKIFTLARIDGQATIRTKTLAKIANVTSRTVQRNLKLLVEKELIIQFWIDNNRSKLKPSPEFINQLYGWMAENETVKGLNQVAAK